MILEINPKEKIDIEELESSLPKEMKAEQGMVGFGGKRKRESEEDKEREPELLKEPEKKNKIF